MTPIDFGVYGFLQASVNVIVVLTSLNLPTPIAVVLARGRRGRLRLENTVLGCILFGSAMLAALCALSCFYLAFPPMPIRLEGLTWFIVFAAMTSLQLLSGSALIARGQQLSSAVGFLVSALVLCLAVATSESLSLTQALRLAGISVSLGGALSAGILLSGGLHGDLKHVGGALAGFLKRSGGGIFLFSVLSFFASLSFQVGLWFLQRQLLAYGGAVEGATFALGNQFYNVVLFLPGVLGPLLLRRLSVVDKECKQVWEALRGGGAAVCAAVLGVAAFTAIAPFMLVVLPNKYRVGVEPLTLAVVAGAIMLAKAPFSVFFQARVSATAELLGSLLSTAVLVVGASVPSIVMNAIGSLWLRVAAHFALLLVVFGAFIVRWQAVRADRSE